MRKKGHLRYSSLLILAIVLGLNFGCAAARKGAKQSGSTVMSELDLQSSLMSFADCSASIFISALEEFDAQNPTPEGRSTENKAVAHATALQKLLQTCTLRKPKLERSSRDPRQTDHRSSMVPKCPARRGSQFDQAHDSFAQFSGVRQP